jgi:hypothetical protein
MENNKTDLDQMAKAAFDETKGLAQCITTAIESIACARTELFGWDGHNESSYRYCDKRLDAARLALVECMAHIVCVATKVPSHDCYRGGIPHHISDLRESNGWCE